MEQLFQKLRIENLPDDFSNLPLKIINDVVEHVLLFSHNKYHEDRDPDFAVYLSEIKGPWAECFRLQKDARTEVYFSNFGQILVRNFNEIAWRKKKTEDLIDLQCVDRLTVDNADWTEEQIELIKMVASRTSGIVTFDFSFDDMNVEKLAILLRDFPAIHRLKINTDDEESEVAWYSDETPKLMIRDFLLHHLNQQNLHTLILLDCRGDLLPDRDDLFRQMAHHPQFECLRLDCAIEKLEKMSNFWDICLDFKNSDVLCRHRKAISTKSCFEATNNVFNRLNAKFNRKVSKRNIPIFQFRSQVATQCDGMEIELKTHKQLTVTLRMK
ncbi:hypothetical protein QR680_006135 [Steinernema hermaphroditum]|uniref:Uncharacterized protein n=1 Tax=Steinernema hermaphroditum TaxID=289476 RepID=A0AA39HWS1_9BILA|nr:hypothetical protein QR680_006135 [Steinernema hermaphroditum]